MFLQATVQDRISEVVRRAGGKTATSLTGIGMTLSGEPNRLRDALTTVLPAQVIVTGTLERRLLLAEHPDHQAWTAADLSGQPHHSRSWPPWARVAIDLDENTSWISTARISPAGVHRLTRPEVLLVALYHPEYFPLPRFPLAISDLARAARSTMIGRVRLLDMQLGPTFEHRGVAQLESSLGCTNCCSFCPRGHKGHWSSAHPEALPWIVTAMREVFDRYPEVSRTHGRFTVV